MRLPDKRLIIWKSLCICICAVTLPIIDMTQARSRLSYQRDTSRIKEKAKRTKHYSVRVPYEEHLPEEHLRPKRSFDNCSNGVQASPLSCIIDFAFNANLAIAQF